MTFALHGNFTNHIELEDLEISKVLLQKITEVPWIILIPRINNLKNIFDLDFEKQIILQKEINFIGRIMKEVYNFDQINIATIGNITPQLHIHIVARFADDAFWPETIWGKKFTNLTEEETLNKYRYLIKGIKNL